MSHIPYRFPSHGGFPIWNMPKISDQSPDQELFFFPAPELSWVSHFLDPNPWFLVHGHQWNPQMGSNHAPLVTIPDHPQCVPIEPPSAEWNHKNLRRWERDGYVTASCGKATKSPFVWVRFQPSPIGRFMALGESYIHGDMIEEYRGYTHPLVPYSWSGPSGWLLSQSLFVSRALLGCYPSC